MTEDIALVYVTIWETVFFRWVFIDQASVWSLLDGLSWTLGGTEHNLPFFHHILTSVWCKHVLRLGSTQQRAVSKFLTSPFVSLRL
jgi:hypothetical protein